MDLEPSDKNARRLVERGIEGPVTMLNLLRSRKEADYAELPQLAPPSPISGRAAYRVDAILRRGYALAAAVDDERARFPSVLSLSLCAKSERHSPRSIHGRSATRFISRSCT